jgi:tetratricopeptide (TPR) repeat protein
MIRLVLVFAFAIFLLIVTPVDAQPETSQTLAEKIVSAYERFDYEEADRLLKIAVKESDSFSPQDRIIIYQYAAFRQYQKDQPFKAEEYFWRILELDPTFSLDPITTPPKILTLFQKTKVDFLESLQQRLQQLEQSVSYHPVPWRSLIFPGLAQWHRGYRLKGALWMAAGTGCLAGLAQAVIRTQDKKREYEAAASPEEIAVLYNEYNRVYQSQFYWAYAYMAVWLSSHIDALFFSPVKSSYPVSLSLHPAYPGLTCSIRF